MKTPNEVAAIEQQFNEQHANLNSIEDWSMVILFGLIVVTILVMELWDNRKANG